MCCVFPHICVFAIIVKTTHVHLSHPSCHITPFVSSPPPPPPPPQLGIKKLDPEGLLQGAKFIVTQNKQLRKELLEIERDVNNLKSENDCLVSVYLVVHSMFCKLLEWKYVLYDIRLQQAVLHYLVTCTCAQAQEDLAIARV